VVLKSVKNWILEVDTPGQHMSPRVRYELRICFPNQEGDTFPAVEHGRHRPHQWAPHLCRLLPHYELVLSTVSGGCAVVHGQRPCSPSHNRPVDGCLCLHRAAHHRHAPCVPSPCATRRVDVDVVHPQSALRTTPGQAMPYSAGPHPWACCRRLATGEPSRTVPRHGL
jgi:hypothetical protein